MMTDDLLDALMCEVLAKMSVISEQKGRSYDGISVHGGEKAGLQPLIEKPLVDYYRDRYSHAHSPRARRAVVLAATEALRIARRMPIPVGQPPTLDDPQWKRWVAESSKETGELARLFNVPRQYIQRIRKAYRAAGV